MLTPALFKLCMPTQHTGLRPQKGWQAGRKDLWRIYARYSCFLPCCKLAIKCSTSI